MIPLGTGWAMVSGEARGPTGVTELTLRTIIFDWAIDLYSSPNLNLSCSGTTLNQRAFSSTWPMSGSQQLASPWRTTDAGGIPLRP